MYSIYAPNSSSDSRLELYFAVYDPTVPTRADSMKTQPQYTLAWIVDSLPEWVAACDEALQRHGLTAIGWLASFDAFELNTVQRPQSIHRLSMLPPAYDSIANTPLSAVVEEDEGSTIGSAQSVVPMAGLQRSSPGARANRSTPAGDHMMNLVYELTDSGERQVPATPQRGRRDLAHRITEGRLAFLQGLIGGVVTVVNTLRGVSGRDGGSGTSSRRGGSPTVVVPFDVSAPSSSSSSRARSPGGPQFKKGSPSFTPPTSYTQRSSPSPGRSPGVVTLSPSGVHVRPPPSPSASHQQHADYTQELTRKKMWTDTLSPSFSQEPATRSFTMQGINPVPLLFTANDQSGDTATINLHLGDVVLKNDRPRNILNGEIPELAATVAKRAGDIMSKRI